MSEAGRTPLWLETVVEETEAPRFCPSPPEGC